MPVENTLNHPRMSNTRGSVERATVDRTSAMDRRSAAQRAPILHANSRYATMHVPYMNRSPILWRNRDGIRTSVPIPKFASTRRTSDANFGIKGTLATFWLYCGFEFEVPNRACIQNDRNVEFTALATLIFGCYIASVTKNGGCAILFTPE